MGVVCGAKRSRDDGWAKDTMDELVHHCLREVAFDADLGMSLPTFLVIMT